MFDLNDDCKMTLKCLQQCLIFTQHCTTCKYGTCYHKCCSSFCSVQVYTALKLYKAFVSVNYLKFLSSTGFYGHVQVWIGLRCMALSAVGKMLKCGMHEVKCRMQNVERCSQPVGKLRSVS